MSLVSSETYNGYVGTAYSRKNVVDFSNDWSRQAYIEFLYESMV